MQDRLREYRELRSELERNILGIATSVDGRRFEYQAPLGEPAVQPGGYAMLGDRLAQVLSARLDRVEAAEVGWEGDGDSPGMRSRVAIRMTA